jgi:hypothetical protein
MKFSEMKYYRQGPARHTGSSHAALPYKLAGIREQRTVGCQENFNQRRNQ